MVAAGLVLAFTPAFRGVLASDQDSIVWGATDPTWSPDGNTLAFSLFGSIWQVPVKGGTAEQVTSSPGYHAHPAWSPKGGRIAFINGETPRGRLPNISGTLTIIDLASGTERRIATPRPVAGTLAWSPAGDQLVCGLAMPEGGSLLHAISAGDGAVERLQAPVQGEPLSGWIDAAWSPGGPEIFFAATRGAVPQVWSMLPGRPRVQMQLPLTGYRREDIPLLHSLSALPDGSGVIYSACLVNGRGNYELYRVGNRGGRPEALTNTARDEFSPAVSPDGRWIAHVSNRMGNIDLFVMPISGGEQRHVRIKDLKFRQPSGRIRVRVVDEQGHPTAARLYVRASDGKAYCPPGAPIYYMNLDPGPRREGLFLAGGDDTFPAPNGRLQLVAVKGVEYEPAERTLQLAAGETTEVTIQMNRWTNWLQRGWYTGENHFHLNYNGSYYHRPAQAMRWIQAEDLNAANMVTGNSEGAFIHDIEFFSGAVNPLSGGRYILYWGQEYRSHPHLGHMAFLNIRKQVDPSFTGVIGSKYPYDVPLNTAAAIEARKRGGLVTYVHPQPGAFSDVFDSIYGAKELPVTAAFGGVDSMDILPYGEPAYEMWYRLLNSGFKITAGAGTDCFTNYRSIHHAPGSSRIYVDTGATLTWSRWLERYREGRNFATTGPLLTFRVNGEPPGAEIRVPAGQPYNVNITAEAVCRTPLRRLELLQNGRVIEAAEAASGARNLTLVRNLKLEQSCWLAVRARGDAVRGISPQTPTMAHSTPVYLTVGGRPALVAEDLRLMLRWIGRLWALLEDRNNFGAAENRERARQTFEQARAHYEKKLRLASGAPR